MNRTIFVGYKFFSYFSKKNVDIGSVFCRNFKVRMAVLLNKLFYIFRLDLSLEDVYLIAYKKNESVLPSFISDKIVPTINSFKGCTQTEIEYD